jgi:hypothetical protein
MGEICCHETEKEPRKPMATIELPEVNQGFKIGEEVEVKIKGKLVYMEAGKRWPEVTERANRGEIRLEVKSVKLETEKSEFAELAED